MPSITPKSSASGMSQPAAGTYSPSILPLMQSLLRTLADIDFEFEGDRETILKSAVEEPLKQNAIARLEQCHQERRAPYLREITMLQKHVEVMLA